MNNDVIYPTMVIRSQAESIELQEKEINRLNKELDISIETINNKNKKIIELSKILNEYEKIKNELLDYIYHNEYCRFGHIDGGEADEMRNIINKIDRLKEGEYSEK